MKKEKVRLTVVTFEVVDRPSKDDMPFLTQREIKESVRDGLIDSYFDISVVNLKCKIRR